MKNRAVFIFADHSARSWNIREIDCWEIARVAKRTAAPANGSAGVRLLRAVGDVVAKGERVFEAYAQSTAQHEFSRVYAESHPKIVRFGFQALNNRKLFPSLRSPMEPPDCHFVIKLQ